MLRRPDKSYETSHFSAASAVAPRRWGRWALRAGAALLVVLALGAVGAPGPAAAREADGRASPVTSRERDLAVIRGEIEVLQGRLGAARERESDLQGRLEALDLETRLQEKRLAEAVAARDLAAARSREAETAVEYLAADLVQVRSDLRRRLVGLYRLGSQGYLRLMLAAEPGSDVLSAVRAIRYLVRRDRATLDRYEELKTELDQRRDSLAAHLAEVEEWTRAEEARRRELDQARLRQRRRLAEAADERAALAARTRELEEKERKLSALLDGLYFEQPLEGAPLADFRGVLDWPVEGRVSVGFGPRLDPRYRTRVPHNGIEITTSPSSRVRVVYPGKVLYAAPLEGYGPTAVVHHAGRAFTLYAGLRHLSVAEGDMLSLGDVLGTSSDRMYFEVRVENRPEDPLRWLR